jgi:hypothetical protein
MENTKTFIYANGKEIEEEVLDLWFENGAETIKNLQPDNFGKVSEILTDSGFIGIYLAEF